VRARRRRHHGGLRWGLPALQVVERQAALLLLLREYSQEVTGLLVAGCQLLGALLTLPRLTAGG
jgi:hypothetical protein